MIKIVFSLILGMTIVSISLAQDKEGSIQVAPSDQQCQADSDCMITLTHCGGCSCGAPINTSFNKKYHELYMSFCKNYYGGVCDFYCPTPVATCAEGRCILSKIISKPS
jgi:hypothetical protein